MIKTALYWSGGKDSAWALHMLNCAATHQVSHLICTHTAGVLPLQNIPLQLVKAQAKVANIELIAIEIPKNSPNTEYAQANVSAVSQLHRKHRVRALAFGDIHLSDIRKFRESMFATTDVKLLFPLWNLDTTKLASDMLQAGLQAILTCVDTSQLSEDFVGRAFDADLLSELPAQVDRCGEHGEFHTFCHAGPMFDAAIDYNLDTVRTESQFIYQDLGIAH